MKFEKMGLHPKLLASIDREGYSKPTPIQAEAIPLILAGGDVMGCAQTGTGKTAAFALPTLHRLLVDKKAKRDEGNFDPRTIGVLVLTPTRELASQVKKSYATYGRKTKMKQTVIYGGVSQNPQTKSLRLGTDVVIATPGRLLDLMNQGHVDLSELKVLVLDEADQMLDMGFIHDLRKIVKHVPKKRQTLMFSATMPPAIRRLSEEWLEDPTMLQSTPEASTPEKIKQTVTFVSKQKKPSVLVRFLESTDGERNLVFCRTKRGVDRVVRYLRQARFQAMGIHGDKTQRARQDALEKFTSPSPPILVATDVAARGLHMPDVSNVINYDLPHIPETYVHRIGRTARAGAEGASISLCSDEERSFLKQIEKLIKQSVEVSSTSDEKPSRSSKTTHAKSRHKPEPKQSSRKSGTGKSRRKKSGRPFKSKGPVAGNKKRRSKSRQKKKSV